tara:strand:- start:102 stop:317 length:216 start_codon:yes stop_codon:yes gene_type:complete
MLCSGGNRETTAVKEKANGTTCRIKLPEAAIAPAGQHAGSKNWSRRMKLVYFLATSTSYWAFVLAPFFLLG